MNPEFDITETRSYHVTRWGELVAELSENEWRVVQLAAQCERIHGMKILRAVAELTGTHRGLKECRDLIDAARQQQ